MIDKTITLGVTLLEDSGSKIRLNCEIEEDKIDMRIYSRAIDVIVTNDISDVAKIRDLCNEIIKCSNKHTELCDHDYVFIGHQLNGHYSCRKCNHIKEL